jgi:hypothetical protein
LDKDRVAWRIALERFLDSSGFSHRGQFAGRLPFDKFFCLWRAAPPALVSTSQGDIRMLGFSDHSLT